MNAQLARVVYMASVGGFAAVHQGRLVDVEGRMVWRCREDLARDVRRVGVEASTIAINTAR